MFVRILFLLALTACVGGTGEDSDTFGAASDALDYSRIENRLILDGRHVAVDMHSQWWATFALTRPSAGSAFSLTLDNLASDRIANVRGLPLNDYGPATYRMLVWDAATTTRTDENAIGSVTSDSTSEYPRFLRTTIAHASNVTEFVVAVQCLTILPGAYTARFRLYACSQPCVVR